MRRLCASQAHMAYEVQSLSTGSSLQGAASMQHLCVSHGHIWHKRLRRTWSRSSLKGAAGSGASVCRSHTWR